MFSLVVGIFWGLPGTMTRDKLMIQMQGVAKCEWLSTTR